MRRLRAAGATYIVFGVETAPTTGTLHWQGYTEFDKIKRKSQVAGLITGWHVERRLGTAQQAADYCKGLSAGKIPNDIVFEEGEISKVEPGKRNDIHDAHEILKTQGITAVAEEHPEILVKYPRGVLLLNTFIKKPKPVPQVHLVFGPSDVGKTRRFFDQAPPDDFWRAPITDGLWFDGYYGQRWALLDDFDGRCSKTPLRVVLQLLDRYPVDVPIKGGFVPWTPEFIYITTNFHPRDWYDWSTRQAQFASLVRRFTYVHWYKPDGSVRTISRPDAELSDDVDVDTTWEHFWDGPNRAQLGLDQASGRLVSHAPPCVFDW